MSWPIPDSVSPGRSSRGRVGRRPRTLHRRQRARMLLTVTDLSYPVVAARSVGGGADRLEASVAGLLARPAPSPRTTGPTSPGEAGPVVKTPAKATSSQFPARRPENSEVGGNIPGGNSPRSFPPAGREFRSLRRASIWSHMRSRRSRRVSVKRGSVTVMMGPFRNRMSGACRTASVHRADILPQLSDLEDGFGPTWASRTRGPEQDRNGE